MDTENALRHYLQRTREALLWKVDGLGERELREPRTSTGTNLLGLVKHCAMVEYGYFGECLGRDPGLDAPPVDEDDPNADLFAGADESAAGLLEFYRRVGAYVDATLTELPLDTTAHVEWWGDDAHTTLGHLLVHVLNDVSRHAGHADILRESIDGAAGLRQSSSNLFEPPGGWDAYRRRLEQIAARFPSRSAEEESR